jgi:glycosyltransferase involved in cell wall biosynthesis
MPSQAKATVLITTRNRIGELRRAIESALSQTAALEIIVVDDASEDGTAEVVASTYPTVIVHRSAQRRGLVVQRNLGVRLAAAPVVVSIDDDAIFSTSHTVEQTLSELDHPRVGAVAIPLVDVARSSAIQQHSPSHNGIHVALTFRGGAFAVRRDVFLAVGGFREVIVHQGEERDYCIRMLAAGFVIRLGRADPVHHFESARRDRRRMDLYGRRNDILYSWHNEPFPYAPLRMAEMTVKGIGWGFKVGRPLSMLRGLAMGYRACWAERGQRAPVPREIARLARKQRKGRSRPLAEMEAELPQAIGLVQPMSASRRGEFRSLSPGARRARQPAVRRPPSG